MNENLNLCEILKDCPKGTKLYSPFFGDCEFVEVRDDYVKVCAGCVSYSINANGTFPFGTFDSEEIMIFPSREQRDWSKWVCHKPKFDPKTLQPFDRVLVFSDYHGWCCDVFSHYESENQDEAITSGGCLYSKVIPYNEETNHLVGTTKEAPEFYWYWEE